MPETPPHKFNANIMPDVINGEGYIPPELQARPKSKEYTKTEALASLDFATGFLNQTIADAEAQINPDVDKQKKLRELKWVQQSVSSAINGSIKRPSSLGGPKDTLTVAFENPQTGEKFAQEEGVPVDRLMFLLVDKARSLPDTDPQKKILMEHAITLLHTSTSYNKLPHHMNPTQFIERVRHEAGLISQDIGTTGSINEDWFRARSELINRRELNLSPLQNLLALPSPTRGGALAAIPEPGNTSLVPAMKPGDLVVPEPSGGALVPVPNPGGLVVSGPAEGGALVPVPNPGELALVEPKTGGPLSIVPEPGKPALVSDDKPPSNEQVRRELILINRTKDLEKRAQDMAERQLREEMRRGSSWNPLNWCRKIRLHVGEDFYRQQYIERARQAMLANNNSYLQMDVVTNAAVQANAGRAEAQAAGLAKVEQVRLQQSSGEALYGHNIDKASAPFATSMTNEVIRPIVQNLLNGTPVDDALVQQSLRQFMARHENDPDASIRNDIAQYFGRAANQSNRGNLAEYFASDMIQMAEMVAGDLKASKYTLEEIDKFIDIKLAYTSWAAESQANLNRTDQWIAEMQRNQRTRWLANPAFVGAVTSLATLGITKAIGATGRIASFLVPGAGMLTGGIFAAVRRNTELKIDRSAHQVERAYNRQILPNSPRRQEIERFAYDTASAKNLLDGGGNDVLLGVNRESMANLLTGTGAVSAAQEQGLYARIAEIRSRLDFSTSQRSDLIIFDNETNVEQNRLDLLKAVVQARQRLAQAGLSTTQIDTAVQTFRNTLDARFTTNKDTQDRRFAIFRLRKSLITGMATSAAGLGLGMLGQEAAAMIARYVPIISEIPVVGGLFQKGQTTIEKGVDIAATALGHPDFADSHQELFGGLDIQNLSHSPGDHLIHNGVTDQDLHLLVHDQNEPIRFGHADSALASKYQPYDSVFISENNQKIDLLNQAGGKIPEPPMWLKQPGDQQASFIVAGGKAFLPAEVRDMYQGWDFKATSEHNLREYMQSLTKGGISKTPDVVLEHGSFMLNTHDIHQSNFINPQGLSYDEWAAQVGRINPANGLIEQGKMSLTDSSSGVVLHGFLRNDGSFDVGKDFFVNNQYPGNTVINAGQWDTVTNNLRVEGWEVQNTATGFHIIPPAAFEITPPAGESPLIPIPFARRNPLEPLGVPKNPEDQKDKPPTDQQPPADGGQTPVGSSPTQPSVPVGGPTPIGRLDTTIPIPLGPGLQVPQLSVPTEGLNQGRSRTEIPPVLPMWSTPEYIAENRRDLARLRDELAQVEDDTALPGDEKAARVESLQNQINGLERTFGTNEPFTEGERALTEFFKPIYGLIHPGHRYFIEDPQGLEDALSVNRRAAILDQIQTTDPFFVDNDGFPGANRELTPWDYFEHDLRYINAERTTNGDSGLHALAAVSTLLPEDQADLYLMLSKMILDMHRKNPALLGAWLRSQASSVAEVAPNGQAVSSLDKFYRFDRDENFVLYPEARRLLSYDQDGNLDEAGFNSLWQQRMGELAQRLESGRLEPHHLHWIEMLSHSANLRLMIDLLKESGNDNAAVPPAPSQTPPPTPPVMTPPAAPATPDVTDLEVNEENADNAPDQTPGVISRGLTNLQSLITYTQDQIASAHQADVARKDQLKAWLTQLTSEKMQLLKLAGEDVAQVGRDMTSEAIRLTKDATRSVSLSEIRANAQARLTRLRSMLSQIPVSDPEFRQKVEDEILRISVEIFNFGRNVIGSPSRVTTDAVNRLRDARDIFGAKNAPPEAVNPAATFESNTDEPLPAQPEQHVSATLRTYNAIGQLPDEIFSEQEGNVVLADTIIRGTQFQGAQLTPELLRSEGLLPYKKVSLSDSVNAYLSRPYNIVGQRIAVVAYIQTPGKTVAGNYYPGETVARTFYRSNSQGVWRYLPTYTMKDNQINHYNKGYGEESVTLPAELQIALSDLSKPGAQILNVKNPDLIFAGTAREKNNMGTFFSDTQPIPIRLSGEFYSPDPDGKIAPENVRFSNPDQAPNFATPITSWKQNTQLYGQVDTEVYLSNDGALRYLFCRDSQGRAWVGGVEAASGEIKSTGTKDTWVNAGDLTTPPFEYTAYASGYGNNAKRNGSYVDMFDNYLSKIPVIREYLAVKGIKPNNSGGGNNRFNRLRGVATDAFRKVFGKQ